MKRRCVFIEGKLKTKKNKKYIYRRLAIKREEKSPNYRRPLPLVGDNSAIDGEKTPTFSRHHWECSYKFHEKLNQINLKNKTTTHFKSPAPEGEPARLSGGTMRKDGGAACEGSWATTSRDG